jgi:F0F1-type ATP synthase assembly protein I
MTAERIWIIVAAVMVVVAAALLWRNNMSAAFVTATLGAVAWFLSYRAQIQAKLSATEAETGEPETDEDSNEK